MKYILRTFLCNSNLQLSVFVYGVFASVLSVVLLITTLSTDIFLASRYEQYSNHNGVYHNNYSYYDHHYNEIGPLYCFMVTVSILHLISSIFLTIGVEQKNADMIPPWLFVQAITFVSLIPIIAGVLLCFVVVSFPVYIWWAAFSIFVTLTSEEAQQTGRKPRKPTSVAATAQPSVVATATTISRSNGTTISRSNGTNISRSNGTTIK